MIRATAIALALGVLSAGAGHAQSSSFASVCATKATFTETFVGPDFARHWMTITHPPLANANDEMQAYQADSVSNGPEGLRIAAIRRGASYASGRIASLATFRYGCFDIVATMPVGPGLWPALWLRTPYAHPLDGEIDIMEGFGSHPGVVQGTLHHWAAGVHHGFSCSRVGDARAAAFGMASRCAWQPRRWHAAFVTAPHHYSLIWTARIVIWLIDGEPYFSQHEGIPDAAMQLHLNLAVGGVFDGPPDSTTPFPATMTVRSVKVWPLK